MNYDFIQAHCLAKKGAEQIYKQEWGAICYLVGGKMFALAGANAEKRAIISVKHAPREGEKLREKYSDIIPGYYLNKTHWSSVFLDGSVPENVLKQMPDASYELIFNALSKKAQNEILAAKGVGNENK
ncbi:MAG: MmcQ/YjbR family DNA-binding protein [Campylobacteraceae bacterium]|jgi:predicted DNA-binding protein (MmcQ/YjbR family)|nr:MmcQ/YjbR family DNA-binding protein [Campylobacteraceae bacterium]